MLLFTECDALGCQQQCVPSEEDLGTSSYKCDCFEGYLLAEDKKTCEEQGFQFNNLNIS